MDIGTLLAGLVAEETEPRSPTCEGMLWLCRRVQQGESVVAEVRQEMDRIECFLQELDPDHPIAAIGAVHATMQRSLLLYLEGCRSLSRGETDETTFVHADRLMAEAEADLNDVCEQVVAVSA